MVGIKYNSQEHLNGQALAWCNKVNARVHGTTNEIPFERLKKEALNPLSREYIIDKINLRRVQKDCLISYAGSQYSVPAQYVGKDVPTTPQNLRILRGPRSRGAGQPAGRLP